MAVGLIKHGSFRQFRNKLKVLTGLRFITIDSPLTKEDQILFEKATHCHICEKPLGLDKARDHDHVSGIFRGAAHRIPIVIHNLRD